MTKLGLGYLFLFEARIKPPALNLLVYVEWVHYTFKPIRWRAQGHVVSLKHRLANIVKNTERAYYDHQQTWLCQIRHQITNRVVKTSLLRLLKLKTRTLVETGGMWHNRTVTLFGWINLDRLSALSWSPLSRKKRFPRKVVRSAYLSRSTIATVLTCL